MSHGQHASYNVAASSILIGEHSGTNGSPSNHTNGSKSIYYSYHSSGMNNQQQQGITAIPSSSSQVIHHALSTSTNVTSNHGPAMVMLNNNGQQMNSVQILNPLFDDPGSDASHQNNASYQVPSNNYVIQQPTNTFPSSYPHHQLSQQHNMRSSRDEFNQQQRDESMFIQQQGLIPQQQQYGRTGFTGGSPTIHQQPSSMMPNNPITTTTAIPHNNVSSSMMSSNVICTPAATNKLSDLNSPTSIGSSSMSSATSSFTSIPIATNNTSYIGGNRYVFSENQQENSPLTPLGNGHHHVRRDSPSTSTVDYSNDDELASKSETSQNKPLDDFPYAWNTAE